MSQESVSNRFDSLHLGHNSENGTEPEAYCECEWNIEPLKSDRRQNNDETLSTFCNAYRTFDGEAFGFGTDVWDEKAGHKSDQAEIRKLVICIDKRNENCDDDCRVSDSVDRLETIFRKANDVLEVAEADAWEKDYEVSREFIQAIRTLAKPEFRDFLTSFAKEDQRQLMKDGVDTETLNLLGQFFE